ncbi:MAG TPA: TldD/PmbA family protein [Rhodothermia bacterium]|nr:TldD/PmbA family protein [Rhodothermia bacterium]
MPSDPIPAQSQVDQDLDRFESAGAIARAQLAKLSRSYTSYADVFAQQIVHDLVEGRVRPSPKSIPPIEISCKASVAEGIAVRRLGDQTSFAAANGFDSEAAGSLVDRLDRMPGAHLTVAPSHGSRAASDEISEDATAYVRSLIDCVLSGVDHCRLVKARISTFSDRRALINTSGHEGMSERLRSELHVRVETDTMSATFTWVDWGSSGPPSVDPTAVVGQFQRRAGLSAPTTVDLPDRAALLLPPGWGGIWMHEAVGHLLEADTVPSSLSPVPELVGSRVSSEQVDVVDDGTLNPARVAGDFDDEGVGTSATALIERGVIVGLLTDRSTAVRSGLPLTGNGRRSHFGLPPRPRMTNLVMRPGQLTREDLLSLASPLIIVDTMRRACLDANDHQMHLDIEDGMLVRGGEPAGRVGPIIASADPMHLLRGVKGVANDFAIDLHRGYCLKDGAALPVTVGQPSVLIADVAIRPF